jgi:hypothetical protein
VFGILGVNLGDIGKSIQAATPATPPATPAIQEKLNDSKAATPATPILGESIETMPPPHSGSAFSMSRFDLQES